MRNCYYQRKREHDAMSDGRIDVKQRRVEIRFQYKFNWHLYVYESGKSHGFTSIYAGVDDTTGSCIYSTADPSKTTAIGETILNALREQKIIGDGRS